MDKYPNKYKENEIERWSWINKLCGIEIDYRCYDDCKQGGCPSHKFRAKLFSVTDSIIIDFGDGRRITLSPKDMSMILFVAKKLSEN